MVKGSIQKSALEKHISVETQVIEETIIRK